jgi:ParB/RepB/Spo0J family partition protein
MSTDIPVDRIDTLPQDRQHFDDQALDELAQSIAESGLLQPIIVRPAGHRYTLVAGERRLRAVRRLGWATTQANVVDADDQAASLMQLTENVARKSLDPVEEARAYRTRLDRFGWTIDELAGRVGVPEGTIRDRLELLDLIPEVQYLVSHNEMVRSHARVLRFLDGNRQRLALRAYRDHPDIDRCTWEALVRRLRDEQDAELQMPLLVDDFALIAAQYVSDAKQHRRPGLRSLLDLIGRARPHITEPLVAAEATAALTAYGRNP